MLAGPVGRFSANLRHVLDVVGLRPEVREASTVHLLVLEAGALFIADTSVDVDPGPEQLCETTLRAADLVRQFGLEPKVALLSHSNFGSAGTPSARKMREALRLIREAAPDLEVDGEMQADTALSQAVRDRILPGSRLSGEANLLVMPSLDAANIGYNLVKSVTGAVPVGPILLGPRLPAHIVNQSVTTRGIVNMSAIACVQAASLAVDR
jgi:malate dehydrogenase (oxaloacetate-decarboxylating)(NADP+)